MLIEDVKIYRAQRVVYAAECRFRVRALREEIASATPVQTSGEDAKAHYGELDEGAVEWLDRILVVHADGHEYLALGMALGAKAYYAKRMWSFDRVRESRG